jgi:hypothetical protein
MRNIALVLGAIALYLLLLIEWHLRSLARRIDQAQRYLEQIVDLMRLRRFQGQGDDGPEGGRSKNAPAATPSPDEV